ncbi:MAG TPA: DNA mismatch repair endonuclease MutL [Methylomirabilota bacterium]|nr:DNA mismatch repair endonuclease MutL [Methylomirabilota bacterium]
MNRIQLLPEQVANQIAAGEVVERPASVVKELVENALDAEARRVTVEIQAGGRSLIRVTDDGLGMSRDDALLCLERHATSKIRRAEDLSSIFTMGFRGEALPSIASVSRFLLTTRERDQGAVEATQVVINAGRILEVKAAGAAPGTCVEVRQLFSNLPARRKFLRSEETETSHIQHYLTLAALAHPGVAFTLVRDGRTLWQLPPIPGSDPVEAVGQRLRSLQGGETRLLKVDYQGELPAWRSSSSDPEASVPAGALRVRGWIGAPGVSRSTREDQHLFVNRRPVENRGLNYALFEGYHTALMKGRYPVCCLFLELDPAEVDVNIHPSKREVKFHRERAVREHVAAAVREALVAFHSSPAQSPSASPSPGPASSSAPALSFTPEPSNPSQPVPARPSARSFPPRERDLDLGEVSPGKGQFVAPTPRAPAHAGPVPMDSGSPVAAEPDTTPAGVEPAEARQAATGASPASDLPPGATPLLRVPLRLIGVIGRLYVVLESDRGLVLLDQHAAHERILFEQMLRRMEHDHQAPSQRLLLPETVELAPLDARFLREHLSTLTRMGVGLSEFGERTFLLDALPPFVKGSEPRKFVLGLVDELKAAGQGVNLLRLGEETIAKTVCRHAVKANDPLSGPELEQLVADLRRCEMPYTCPH